MILTPNIAVPMVVKFFKAKGALSEEKAVVLSGSDFVEMGIIGLKKEFIFNLTGVQKTSDGKYWMSEEKLMEAMAADEVRQQKIIKTLLIFPLVAVGILLLVLIILNSLWF